MKSSYIYVELKDNRLCVENSVIVDVGTNNLYDIVRADYGKDDVECKGSESGSGLEMISDCRKERMWNKVHSPKKTRSLLDNIPDDILHRLFMESDGNWKEVMRLGIVCRRLREIALASSSIWEQITLMDLMQPEVINAIAERCGSKGLRVVVDEGLESGWTAAGKRANYSSMVALFAHSRRWCDARFTITKTTSRMIRINFSRSDMDRLHTLWIGIFWPEVHLISQPFYSEWRLPALTNIFDKSSIPPFRQGACAPCLKTCHTMVLDENVKDMMDFLSVFPQIDELCVDVYCWIGMGLGSKIPLVLDNIRRLAVTFLGTTDMLFVDFRKSVQTRFVTRLSITSSPMSTERGERLVEGWKRGLRSVSVDYPVLEEFQFVITGRPREPLVESNIPVLFFVEDILLQLPTTIKTVTMSLLCLKVRYGYGSSSGLDFEGALRSYPMLRNISIEGFDDMSKMS